MTEIREPQNEWSNGHAEAVPHDASETFAGVRASVVDPGSDPLATAEPTLGDKVRARFTSNPWLFLAGGVGVGLGAGAWVASRVGRRRARQRMPRLLVVESVGAPVAAPVLARTAVPVSSSSSPALRLLGGLVVRAALAIAMTVGERALERRLE